MAVVVVFVLFDVMTPVDIAPEGVVDTEAMMMLSVHHEKSNKCRETPVPDELMTTSVMSAESADKPLVDVSKRTLRRWVTRTAEDCEEATGDSGWSYLGMHDLRRTWATSLAEQSVDPLLVLNWGGWEDLETFLDHYRGTYSPEVQRAERGNVDWL